MADAVGTVVGACFGTSTVTSYVESSAGVAAGGRTGLTAVTTAVLFFISLIFAPILHQSFIRNNSCYALCWLVDAFINQTS